MFKNLEQGNRYNFQSGHFIITNQELRDDELKLLGHLLFSFPHASKDDWTTKFLNLNTKDIPEKLLLLAANAYHEPRGYTVLGAAAEKGDVAALQKLIDMGANLHTLDVDNKQALHWAIANRKSMAKQESIKAASVVKCLLDNGARTDIKSYQDATPLQYAKGRGYEAAAAMIKEKIRENQREKRKLTLIFDIDNTFADHSLIENEVKLYFLRKSMLIFAGGKEHQVLPCVIELIQVLCSKDYINLAFFSSGPKERNTEFVKELLIRSLGKDKYLEVEPSIIILSKEDLTPAERNLDHQMYLNFDLFRGDFKKDINKALVQDGTLANAILIDDSSTFIYYGQQGNFLRSPYGNAECFNELKQLNPDSKCYEYRSNELFFKVNTIFYIAGVLSDCINEFTKGHDVTKLLFDMHFKKKADKLFAYEPRYDCMENKEYYAKGLAFLRTVKPDICFVSYDDYVSTLNTPITEQEQQVIDDYKSKQTNNEDCLVM